MLGFLRDHGSSLPLVIMLTFVGVSALVIFYVCTDRRRTHLRRMESMPLDDGQAIVSQKEVNHG